MRSSARERHRGDEPLEIEDQPGLPVLINPAKHKTAPEPRTDSDYLATVNSLNSSLSADAGDVAVVNARVWTGNDRQAWADALLTSGDRIALAASSAEVMKRANANVRVIDA